MLAAILSAASEGADESRGSGMLALPTVPDGSALIVFCIVARSTGRDAGRAGGGTAGKTGLVLGMDGTIDGGTGADACGAGREGSGWAGLRCGDSLRSGLFSVYGPESEISMPRKQSKTHPLDAV